MAPGAPQSAAAQIDHDANAWPVDRRGPQNVTPSNHPLVSTSPQFRSPRSQGTEIAVRESVKACARSEVRQDAERVFAHPTLQILQGNTTACHQFSDTESGNTLPNGGDGPNHRQPSPWRSRNAVLRSNRAA